MNIRKNIDYTDMYATLDTAMEKDFSQMELYYEIGKAVCQRTEKGAAVAAAAYLSKQYPDVHGFSPRNLRRMREFYRTYGDYPDLLAEALQIGWTQNVVIMEADLIVEAREWYLKAAKRIGWSKNELTMKIASNAYEEVSCAIDEKLCYTIREEKTANKECAGLEIHHLLKQVTAWWTFEKERGKEGRRKIVRPVSLFYIRC